MKSSTIVLYYPLESFFYGCSLAFLITTPKGSDMISFWFETHPYTKVYLFPPSLLLCHSSTRDRLFAPLGPTDRGEEAKIHPHNWKFRSTIESFPKTASPRQRVHYTFDTCARCEFHLKWNECQTPPPAVRCRDKFNKTVSATIPGIRFCVRMGRIWSKPKGDNFYGYCNWSLIKK